MSKKLCLMTGGTSGIGKAAALGLATLGFSLVIVGHDKEKGEAALREVREKSGNQDVALMLADLSSMQAVRQLAADFMARHDRLDVLVNNAGVFLLRRHVTVDGFEMTFAVNHLAHFLLTNLLTDMIKRSSPSRIVNTASATHYGARMDFDDLQGTKHYGSFRAYGQSKLANVLFSYELARRLEGNGVTVNCLHPGFIRTDLGHENGPIFRFGYSFARLFAKSPEKGAQTLIYAASAPEIAGTSGKYFADKKEVKSSEGSYSEEAAKRLWQVSAELTGLG